jgi:hypothetical protein
MIVDSLSLLSGFTDDRNGWGKYCISSCEAEGLRCAAGATIIDGMGTMVSFNPLYPF